MKQSKLAVKTRKEFSSKAFNISHKWLERSGFITQHSAGVYHYGHFMTKTINNIEGLMNKHLEKIGATQVQLSLLQSTELWKQSGRFDLYQGENSGAMFTTKSREDNLFTLAASAEEVATEYIKSCDFTAKNFALNNNNVTIFQHGIKLRDEIRAAGGVLRTKEFKMMDAYSFSLTEEDMKNAYNETKKALSDFLDELGLEYSFVKADNGDMGGSISEELMVFTEIGDDIIWTDESGQSANEEVADKINWVGNIKKRKALEVGHIFQLGTNYSEKFDLTWDSSEGKKILHMGCYGIGTSRLIAAYIEKNNDEYGMIFDKSISAYKVHILKVGKSEEMEVILSNLISKLEQFNISYLIDDRKVRAGAKFMEADMFGMTKQIVLGDKVAKENKVEVKDRRTNERILFDIEDFELIKNII